MSELRVKPLFNPDGDTDKAKRRIIGGNTTNLQEFNSPKYEWASKWYRASMNNFWIN
jgi:ribonucleoside-diphosphate reductase beta chain